MLKTYSQRKHWIKTNHPSVLTIFDHFPLLKKPKYVSILFTCTWFVYCTCTCVCILYQEHIMKEERVGGKEHDAPTH